MIDEVYQQEIDGRSYEIIDLETYNCIVIDRRYQPMKPLYAYQVDLIVPDETTGKGFFSCNCGTDSWDCVTVPPPLNKDRCPHIRAVHEMADQEWGE